MIISGILLGIPVGLILKEPDLGMSVLLFPIFAAMIFIAGINLRPLVRILTFRPVLIFLIVVISVSSLYKIHLKEYWKLSEQSFTKLERKDVPLNILHNLDKLKDKEYTDQKKFLSDLEKWIGKEQRQRKKRWFE